MKKITQQCGQVTFQTDRAYHLAYFLVESSSEEGQKALYGVRVEKSKIEGTEKIMVEANEVEAISYSKELVEQMINILQKHMVTPMCLDEIVDDFISKQSMTG